MVWLSAVASLIFVFNVWAAPLEEVKFRGSSVLEEVPLIDGHNDLPYNLYEVVQNRLRNFNFDSDLTAHPIWGPRTSSHTDLPRLRKGKVGGQFWAAFVGCDSIDKDAVELTVDQIDVIQRLVEAYPNDLKIALRASDIMDAYRENRIASLIGVEGGHSIDNRLGTLRLFYEMGVRYMTLTHNCDLPWADSALVDDDTALEKRNLSTWGEQVLLEMNRLGMMIDLSHVSHGVMINALKITRAPVIFSHSNAYSVHPHRRNAQDDVLLALKKNRGIIMVNVYPGFVGEPPTIQKVIEHLNYIKQLIGDDHIGIGADFGGIDETVEGMEDVSKYPDLFDLLAEEGHGYKPWTADELKKLAGLNLIRVFKEVEEVKDNLRFNQPIEEWIPYQDLTKDNQKQDCRTDMELYRNYGTKNEISTILLVVICICILE